MSLSVSLILGVAALIITIIHAINGRAPLWIAVLLLAIAMMVPGLPIR